MGTTEFLVEKHNHHLCGTQVVHSYTVRVFALLYFYVNKGEFLGGFLGSFSISPVGNSTLPGERERN